MSTANKSKSMTSEELGQRLLQSVREMKAGKAARTTLVTPNEVAVESCASVMEALDAHVAGLDFADALHLRASRHCDALITFDDKSFARRAQRLGLKPTVEVAG